MGGGRPNGAPVDTDTGELDVTTTPTLLLGYVDVISRADNFTIWIVNDGTSDASIQFLASPDGIHPDIETLEPVVVPAGHSTALDRTDGNRRYWSLMGNAVTGTTHLCWGITMNRA